LAGLIAIKTIREGGPYISKLLYQQVLGKVADKSKKPTDSQSLSRREIEVLQLFAEGKSNKETAELLSISQSTLRIHLSNIKRKLFIKTNTDLVRYAIKEGFSSLT